MESNSNTVRSFTPPASLASAILVLASSLECAERDNGSKYVRLAADSAQWVKDAVYAAHGEGPPRDDVYAEIQRIVDAWEEEFKEGLVYEDRAREVFQGLDSDVYTHDLTAWLHASVDRVGYLDEAMQIHSPENGLTLLQYAQAAWREEIGEALLAACAGAVVEPEGDDE